MNLRLCLHRMSDNGFGKRMPLLELSSSSLQLSEAESVVYAKMWDA